MIREIVSHKVNDRQPQLFASGNVSTGGAEQSYEITYDNEPGEDVTICLDFISLEENGVTNEALLAIVIDRLEGFQRGPFACEENADALGSCRDAMLFLRSRTLDRMERGVEGKAEA